MEMIAEREEINVFSFVMKMRANRNHMVQTEVGLLAHCYHCNELLLKTVLNHLYNVHSFAIALPADEYNTKYALMYMYVCNTNIPNVYT